MERQTQDSGAWSPDTLRELHQIDLDWQRRVDDAMEELARVRSDYERRLADERDKRYDERSNSAKEAVAAALASQEKLVSAAFDAAKEAVSTATTTLNDRLGLLNELRDNVLPRDTFEQFVNQYSERHALVLKELAELRQAIAVGPDGLSILQNRSSESSGEEKQRLAITANKRAIILIATAIATVVITGTGLLITFVVLIATGHIGH